MSALTTADLSGWPIRGIVLKPICQGSTNGLVRGIWPSARSEASSHSATRGLFKRRSEADDRARPYDSRMAFLERWSAGGGLFCRITWTGNARSLRIGNRSACGTSQSAKRRAPTAPMGAKSRAQINDESVPMSPFLSRKIERCGFQKFCDRLARLNLACGEGTWLLSLQRKEGCRIDSRGRMCTLRTAPYIKVNIRFKATNGDGDALREDPEDIIESVSPPYLAWAVMD